MVQTAIKIAGYRVSPRRINVGIVSGGIRKRLSHGVSITLQWEEEDRALSYICIPLLTNRNEKIFKDLPSKQLLRSK